MAKIDVTKTELVWPGKYDDGNPKEVPRVNRPFQIIETINESGATREDRKKPQPSLFGVYQGKEGDTFEEVWKNKLIWGDNLIGQTGNGWCYIRVNQTEFDDGQFSCYDDLINNLRMI